MGEHQAQSSNTKVVVRIRPCNGKELGIKRCLEIQPGNSVKLTSSEGQLANKQHFTYDKVYDSSSTQAQVFEDLKDIVAAVLAGYNGTVMAYGQTGSGKTHTLMGDISSSTEWGIVPRAVAELGRGIAQYPNQCTFKVTLSVIEIYMEKIKDLLDPAGDNLQVVQDRDRGVIVSEATELPVGSEGECVKLMETGLRNRAVSATAMNAGSSRSHCVVYLLVEKAFPDGRVEYGKLALVDLAGSERQEKTQAQGQTLQEGTLINKSLSSLGNVVHALTDGKSKGHIPYSNASETLSTLRFGQRAKGIQNTVQSNVVKRSPEQMEKLLMVMQAENDTLKQKLEDLQKRNSNLGQQSACSRVDIGIFEHMTSLNAWESWFAGAGTKQNSWLVTGLQVAGLIFYFIADRFWLRG